VARAEFVVMICGDVMTMPGFAAVPAAYDIGLDEQGNIVGMF
jgi:formate--tetrahydrofolate ligase